MRHSWHEMSECCCVIMNTKSATITATQLMIVRDNTTDR